jgi:translation initiation factor IF-3
MPIAQALETARQQEFDLVEVAPEAQPPVCRIMDFGKFKYQQKKRQHKGHTHHSKNKELRVRPKIGDHDLMTKVNRAKEFLDQKDKVIFSVIFRGRENAHIDEGYKLVDRLIKELDTVAKLEQNPSMQGRRIVAPNLAAQFLADRPARPDHGRLLLESGLLNGHHVGAGRDIRKGVVATFVGCRGTADTRAPLSDGHLGVGNDGAA